MEIVSYFPSLYSSSFDPSHAFPPPFTVTKNFVSVLRAMETSLGVPVENLPYDPSIYTGLNVTDSIMTTASLADHFNEEVRSALADSMPILARILADLGLDQSLSRPVILDTSNSPLTTK